MFAEHWARWLNNIKTNLKETVCALDSSGLGLGQTPVVGSPDSFGYMRDRKFLG
jgi:hypothetical protein